MASVAELDKPNTNTHPKPTYAASKKMKTSQHTNFNKDLNTDLALDKDGHLQHHESWSPAVAQQLAATLEVSLTTEHLQILYCVREFYARFEHAPATRPLIKFLVQSLPELPISNAYLQTLFNTGLVARHLSRLAGLPKPANCL